MRAFVLILAMAVSPIGAVVCEFACLPAVAAQADGDPHAHHHGAAASHTAAPTEPTDSSAPTMAALDDTCDLVAPALVSARWTSRDRGVDGQDVRPPVDESRAVLSPIATADTSPPGFSPPPPIRSNLPLRI
jgi:hypothetical protein